MLRPKTDIEKIAKENNLKEARLYAETKSLNDFFNDNIVRFKEEACGHPMFDEACKGEVRPKLMRAYMLYTSRQLHTTFASVGLTACR